MTEAELVAAQQALQMESLRNAVMLTAQVTVTAALVTSVVEGVFAVMEEGLRYYDGEISKAELHSRVLKRIGKRAALAVVVSGVVVGLALVFPAFTPVLSALALPMAVVSFFMLGNRFYTLSTEWMQRVELDSVLTTWIQSRGLPSKAWQEVRTSTIKSWQGANALSNRVWEWVG